MVIVNVKLQKAHKSSPPDCVCSSKFECLKLTKTRKSHVSPQYTTYSTSIYDIKVSNVLFFKLLAGNTLIEKTSMCWLGTVCIEAWLLV